MMNRAVLGAMAALLLAAAGLFWWQGRAATESGAPPPSLAPRAVADPDALPLADASGMRGPAPPEATEITREQRRFDRVDRNRDQIITRNELLALRADAFRDLDADGNNLLTFEEWAVKTSNRFRGADGNGDGRLTRGEFFTTRPKPAAKPDCQCSRPQQARSKPKPGRDVDPLDYGDEAEPEA